MIVTQCHAPCMLTDGGKGAVVCLFSAWSSKLTQPLQALQTAALPARAFQEGVTGLRIVLLRDNSIESSLH